MCAGFHPEGCTCQCPGEGERVDTSPPSPRGVVCGARASRHLSTLSPRGGVRCTVKRHDLVTEFASSSSSNLLTATAVSGPSWSSCALLVDVTESITRGCGRRSERASEADSRLGPARCVRIGLRGREKKEGAGTRPDRQFKGLLRRAWRVRDGVCCARRAG